MIILFTGNEKFVPRKQSEHASGFDLFCAEETPICLSPLERKKIYTGISIEIPEGYEGQIRPRSGLALKHGITVLNSPGTVDSDYRGDLCVILINLGHCDYTIVQGDRIAQLIIAKTGPILRGSFLEFRQATKLNDTDRQSGGFGHTGR